MYPRWISRIGAPLIAFVLTVAPSVSTVHAVEDARKVSVGALLPTWTILGVAYSAVMTPSGRLLRRSARAADRPTLFAAQFALSHACWLLTYPLAGWLGSSAGIVPTLLVLAVITLAGFMIARRIWPANDADINIRNCNPSIPMFRESRHDTRMPM